MWDNNQALEMVNALILGTKSGTITWGDTAEENTFRAMLRNGIVRISRYEHPYGQMPEGGVPITTGLPFSIPPGFRSYGPFIFTLFVLDTQSREVTRFIATNQTEAAPLETLWQLAFGVARDPEKKLQSILEEITGRAKK